MSAAALVCSGIRPRVIQTSRGFHPFSHKVTPPPRTTAEDIPDNSSSSSQEVPKVVVFGGNGFVGQHVCQAALRLGAEVVSVNRSGAPPEGGKDWVGDVRWVRGDIFKPEDYSAELSDATGVVSCVGAFGSDIFMEKICGDATVTATEAAEKAGVERFAFISAAGCQHDHVLLKGYWKGKQKAEAAILERFPDDGVILRPGGIYGDRRVGSVTLPLGFVMGPMEMVLSLPPFSSVRSMSPFEAVLTPPVAVENVGTVAAGGVLGLTPSGVLSVDDINRLAKDLDEK
ncbi:unnamed protein product [Ascophyllum nodosum]